MLGRIADAQGGDHLLRRGQRTEYGTSCLPELLGLYRDLLQSTTQVARLHLERPRNVRKRRGTGTAGGQVQQINRTLLPHSSRWRGTATSAALCWPAAREAACARPWRPCEESSCRAPLASSATWRGRPNQLEFGANVCSSCLTHICHCRVRNGMPGQARNAIRVRHPS